MVTALDRLFLGAFSAPTADAEAWGVAADLAASGAVDWSSNGGFLLNDPNKSDITLDEDTINTGNGSDHVYGHLEVILPQFTSSSGLVITFLLPYPAGDRRSDRHGRTSTSSSTTSGRSHRRSSGQSPPTWSVAVRRGRRLPSPAAPA